MSRPKVTAIALEHGIDSYAMLEDYEERAAIREYLGGASRREAERGAVGDCAEIARRRAR